MSRQEIEQYVRSMDAEMGRDPTPDADMDQAIARLMDEASAAGDALMHADCERALVEVA